MNSRLTDTASTWSATSSGPAFRSMAHKIKPILILAVVHIQGKVTLARAIDRLSLGSWEIEKGADGHTSAPPRNSPRRATLSGVPHE